MLTDFGKKCLLVKKEAQGSADRSKGSRCDIDAMHDKLPSDPVSDGDAGTKIWCSSDEGFEMYATFL